MLDSTLLLVRSPHDRTAAIADPKAIAGDERDLLIIGPEGLHFFGTGARVAALVTAWPGGWSGGDLPRAGFFGHPQPIDEGDVLRVLARAG
jgi:hypothetical protein